MDRRRVFEGRRTLVGLALMLATLISLVVSGLAYSAAETSPEYQVKAVFLFNFAQFVEWPPQSFADPAAPFVIGVLGADPFGSALEGAVRGETLNGRKFVIERYRSVTEIRHCQILFISRSEAAHIEEVGAALAGHSILTVSDIEDSALRGVMIRFVAENNRIRLRINADAAKAATQQAQLYGALQRAYDDLRQSQQTALQQERLRALGQMASGIAHDINNAISPVALYTESLLEREPNLSERTRSYLVTIQRAIEDVAETVARMREFYRPREPQIVLGRIHINRAVQQIVELTRARWSDDAQQRGIMIELRTELADDLPELIGAESEVRDALTNLVFNAVDAMPNGGILTLRTCLMGSQRVCLEVSDTGLGMDEETRRRCLEPFYTTKGERGTGLGLAMVYGMIQRHSAELQIDSGPGKGTAMRLIFTLSAPDTAASGVVPVLVPPQSPLRILLVDDDPVLLQSLRDTLEGEGHSITATSGGQAGIDAFAAAAASRMPFDVVVTDLGMPYVDGRKVAATVRAASPTVAIVMLTGWGQRLVADDEVPLHVDRVLNKPPRLAELRAILAELTA